MSEKTNWFSTIGKVISEYFHKGLKSGHAIGISIILHLIAGMAMAWFFMGTVVVTMPHSEQSIEFDLVTDHSNSQSADQPDGQKMGKPSLTSSTSTGIAQNIPDKNAILMASLGDLSALKKTLSFALQQISSDSTGFSPMQGKVPNTAFYGAGSDNHAGTGRGGIRFGICAPGPRR